MPPVAESDQPSAPEIRIGLIQCGHLMAELVRDHGDYADVFADLLGPFGVRLQTWDVTAGELPSSTDECDGWLVSGSASSTYDDLAWIAPAERFLRETVGDGVPMIAICFGHQLLAQAMGGKVARADAGWGAGAHDYELVGPVQPWMDPPPHGRVRLVASHQDQVVDLPPRATVLARTEHCPIAAFMLGPAALAIQPHPEFTAEVSRELVDLRRDRLGPDVADAALSTLEQPLDQALVGSWMANFWRVQG